MTENPPSLHVNVIGLAEALVRDAKSHAQIVREGRNWLGIEETSSGINFVDAGGDELGIVPFLGDREALESRPYVREIRPAWLDGEAEIVIDASQVTSDEDRALVVGLMRSSLDYWTRATAPMAHLPDVSPVVDPPPGELEVSPEVLPTDLEDEPDPGGAVPTPTAEVKLRADINQEWSWASSVARIPQIHLPSVELVEPLDEVRLTVEVRDADLVFGSTTVTLGDLPPGETVLEPIHVPLSPHVMAQVDERRSAECAIHVESETTPGQIARMVEAVDIQPRDLWSFHGDSRRSERRERLVRRHEELVELLHEDADREDGTEVRMELTRIQAVLAEQAGRDADLARALLAAFVRPNRPEIREIAAEAARILGSISGEASFHSFQLPEWEPDDVVRVHKAVDDTVTAIYDALRARRIAYSEPPPGWDYSHEGQRIRDHDEVAAGGLGTCMDTTALMAAVMEHVGISPVLVLIPGHIFIGYWRRDPAKSGRKGQDGTRLVPEWHPRSALVSDLPRIRNLVDGGYLGLIETTAFTTARNKDADAARGEAHQARLAAGMRDHSVTLVDVLMARELGVSPLPAVVIVGGEIKVFVYQPDGSTRVIDVEPAPSIPEMRTRQVDTHPVRYRTWKSSLFSLSSTNALLNLGRNARVQPIVLPPQALGTLEDRLNQGHTFALHSAYDLPEIWRARERENALQLLESSDPGEREELVAEMRAGRVYIQRLAHTRGDIKRVGHATFFREMRTMANGAKTARDERGMNPLFLCLGLLRWEYKPDTFAEAPLILVPVNIAALRGRGHFSMTLDASQQTTPNAALIEWLKREAELTVPGLTEPVTDSSGIDVDAVITDLRNALLSHHLPFRGSVVSEARLATLDLSAFRMWQDLNLRAERFLERPLVRHLVHSPTETFQDPVLVDAGEASDARAGDADIEDQLEKLETPIPADSTQKHAVLWARQGRTFVLQGPPGTGKSQTITNMVAECLLAGMRVLFVAEKGTALAVVQRRLEAVGLDPFTLNLHHEGSNAAEVRAQLKRSLTVKATPDPLAVESARLRLRNARFELIQYPQKLHRANPAGLSAYAAHDELLVLGEGPTMPIPTTLVAYQADHINELRELFHDLQRWTSAAGVRPDHPWRLAGVGRGEPFDVVTISSAVRDVIGGVAWSRSVTGALREALDSVSHPEALDCLVAAADPALPGGEELRGVLGAAWPKEAEEHLSSCERAVQAWTPRLHGFAPDVLALDLPAIAANYESATASAFLGRRGRQTAALGPLIAAAPTGLELTRINAAALVADLVAVQGADEQIRASVRGTAGLAATCPGNAFRPGAFVAARERLRQLAEATAELRGEGEWTRRAQELACAGHLTGHATALRAYAGAWRTLWDQLAIQDVDFEAWRNGATLPEAVLRAADAWRRDVDFERLVPLLRWCALVRRLEPLRGVGLTQARAELLEGRALASTAEEALARGIAKASLDERIRDEGLDRFDAVVHDHRVEAYSISQKEVRRQWSTDGPARILARRGGGGVGARTGGLARELDKTTRKLGTRPILRRYGRAIQELTPLVLASPSSVVDLIDPDVMTFDVVIFDEASQITVPEAVGALGRARAAIVVGDTKQMPPTRRVGGGSIDEEEIDDPDAEEIVEDQESILSECELARVPTLSLSWHYRSQDEALIAFSNRAYYRGALSSFPTPTLMSSETGVEFRRVTNPDGDDRGLYLRAGSGRVELPHGVVAGPNTNPREATEIVEFVRQLVRRTGPPPSVGIVTFNEPQRQLIEDMLVACPDKEVAAVFDPATMGRGDVMFVKALEQVQGDERDIVIFSVAFSKQANGKIPTNFGPLTYSGGERRLNVAVTRARRKNVVFCSFEPAELDVSAATYQGPKDLKDFLAFARAGGSLGEQESTDQRKALRDRHRDDIATVLRAAGLHVMADVGLSNFRIDLVLARPEDPTRPILPVLLDGESWNTRMTVSDRDVLPVEVLEGLMGWPAVARVWWPMWLQNRAEVIARIMAEVDAAEKRLNERQHVHGQRPQPQEPEAHEPEAHEPEAHEPEAHEPEAHEPEAHESSTAASVDPAGSEQGARATLTGIASVPERTDDQAAVSTVRTPPVGPGPERDPGPDRPDRPNPSEGLQPYTRWKTRPLPPALSATRKELADAIEEIVRAEGPMLGWVAYNRYGEASGQKLGSVIKRSLNQATSQLIRSRRLSQIDDGIAGVIDKTLYVPGRPPVVLRDAGGRDLEAVPRSEVVALMRDLGLTADLTEDLMRRVIEFYGGSSLTQRRRLYLQGCLAFELEQDG